MLGDVAPQVTAYVGIGSNLDHPERQVQSAVTELGEIRATEVRCYSSLYLSPPLGPPDQPDYVNAVAELVTALQPHALLDELQRLESAHGRIRDLRWGPRTLDLDLLLYGTLQLHDSRLTVPHPRLAERAFVVVPLCEIAPDLEIPGGGPLELLKRCFAEDLLRRL
ncbi:MAG: 2-amino-4-hydroxy-6-hydroxymethyldihydropteridine diphosphokinase [Gammaproteobacteria bacterium]|nr:2-amino-4-hydroxy-6-hydroxymethyldihydropteridine diphosphokinase [Gammaproteobacteria bacterium]